MLRIGHFVDRYPTKEHGFVYDQVLRSSTREDRVLAARSTPCALWRARPHDVATFHTIASPALGRSALFDRLYRRLAERHFPGLYAARLSDFLRAEGRRKPIDILHAHFGMAGAQLVDAREKLGIPLVTTFYGVDASACLRDRCWLRRYEALFQRGDLFIALSEAVVERLVAAGCPREKIVVWNIGIDFSDFPDPERRPPSGPVRVLCVARFVEKKGHLILLEAFRRLLRWCPATLTLIGYGDLLPQIQASIGRDGLQDAIRIIDTRHRGDFDSLFRCALREHDLFALPSIVARNGDDEGGPALTMICAQASGMPVVSTPFVGAERSVIDGETGLLCRSGSAESLAEKILLLIENPELARQIGRAGRDLVRREFSLTGQLAALEEQYRSLTGQRRELQLAQDWQAGGRPADTVARPATH